ncbi:hypothetical protein MUK42_12460 [Musa troglodytarum]|uniref:Uncharacterized protein n=1 Tax=Musa troglodytarum TaxID=320322 RepID=A0A9E7GST3_9LILI|nr:hypothetical protein MUK42_12460 [Musa troglodytarum]
MGLHPIVACRCIGVLVYKEGARMMLPLSLMLLQDQSVQRKGNEKPQAVVVYGVDALNADGVILLEKEAKEISNMTQKILLISSPHMEPKFNEASSIT